MATITLRDRFRGAMLGLACGDALGAQVEFKGGDYCKANPVTGMTGGGVFRLAPGQWTDDTSQALAMAWSIVHCRDFDPNDVMERFLDWRNGGPAYCTTGRGCFDIGSMTTNGALTRYASTGNPYSGGTGDHTQANGCLMRLAPAALYAHGWHPADRDRVVGNSSRLTHAHPVCVAASIGLGRVIERALDGVPAEDLCGTGISMPSPVPEVRRIVVGCEFLARPDVEVRGYVLDTLSAALKAVTLSTDFRSAVLSVVNLGGDADTAGAVAGQLAGAVYGAGGIPAEWLAVLDRFDDLVAAADGIFELVAARTPPIPPAGSAFTRPLVVDAA